MGKMPTLFLKVALIIIALPILAICIFLVPELGKFSAEVFPTVTGIKYIFMGIFYASAIFFYFALYQALLLLQYIDKKQAFIDLSVLALKRIKYCAVAISVLHVLALPLFYRFADLDDAPGVILVGCIIPFASMVIAVFAAVLQQLLQQAIDIKSENDLMI